MHNLSDKMATGAAWMVAFKLVERSIGLVSTVILARLLEPGDFGLVAIATAFLSLLVLLTSFSFDVALIQNQNADRNLYDTAWTFNVIFGVSLALALTIAAAPLARFYNEARLENILYLLAAGTLLSGGSNIGPVAFRKDLQFHKEFYFLLAKKLISFIVCMVLAVTLRNYWALVWGSFAGRFLELLLSYRVHPYRPRFCLSSRKELFGFSMWIFVNNTIFFAYHRMADFIVSKVLGSHALGVYTVSYELSNLPTTELVAPINRAVFPAYSKMVGDLGMLRQGFLNVLSIVALCAVPAGIGIALVADLVVVVVLGQKWQEAIPLVQLLAISGVLVALQTNTGSLYMAIGKPHYLTMIALLHVFFLFLPFLVFLLNRHGSIGIAEAYLYSNLIILPINLFVAGRLVQLKISSLLSVLWRPFLACAAMVAFVIFARDYVRIHLFGIDAIRLLTEIGLGALAYVITISFFWWVCRFPEGAEKFIVKTIRAKLWKKTWLEK